MKDIGESRVNRLILIEGIPGSGKLLHRDWFSNH